MQRILGALGAGALGGGGGGGDGVAGELESGAAIVLRLGVGSGEGGAMALTYSLDVREGAFPKEVVSGVAGAFTLLEGGCCDRPTAPMGVCFRRRRSSLRTEKTRLLTCDCSMTHSSPEPSTTVTPSQSCPETWRCHTPSSRKVEVSW